jgi:carboxyl-terminal processing protease
MVNRKYESDEALYENLRDTLSKLGDKYTRFLAPSQFEALMNSALGELTGVGVELLATDDGAIRVVHLEEEAPAFLSGIQPGDLITDVDGTKTAGRSPEEVALLLRGKPDTKATIRVLRAKGSGTSGNNELDFTVVRRPFKLKGVTSEVKEIHGDPVGIITVRSFAGTTRDDIMHSLESFNQRSSRPEKLVLDMRNNGGGLLQGAVETANLFLRPGKVVVFVVDKDGRTAVEQTLPNGVPSQDMNLPDLRTPLYILVNGNTASAAEVLSAALKENGRATLVGEKTFGKGVIQTLQEVRDGAGVAVTIAKYETPAHNNINKIGIPVDEEVTCAPVDSSETCVRKFL